MIMTEIIQVMTKLQVTTTIPMTKVEIRKRRRVKRKREMAQPNPTQYVSYVAPGIFVSKRVIKPLLGWAISV